MNDADGIGRFPRILEPNLGNQFVDSILESELALIGEHENRERRKRLGGRTDPEKRVGGGGAAARDVCHANSDHPLGPIFMDNCDRHAGSMGVLKNFLKLLLQFGYGLRRFWFLVLLIGCCSEGSE